MIYTKKINGRDVFINVVDGYAQGSTIQTEQGWVSNPTEEILSANGWSEFVPPVEPEPIAVPLTEPSIFEAFEAVKRMLSTETAELSDEDALAVAALYPTWVSYVGKEVAAGMRLWYNEKLYKVVQTHTVQIDWTPDITAALYTEISIEEIPAWRQPTGAQDAYMTGDKVKHNDNTWVSTVDNNTWEPGVYGWDQL